MPVQDYIEQAREQLSTSEAYAGTGAELNSLRDAVRTTLRAIEELSAQVNALSDRNPPV